MNINKLAITPSAEFTTTKKNRRPQNIFTVRVRLEFSKKTHLAKGDIKKNPYFHKTRRIDEIALIT